jgi:hypothetical protein
LGCGVARRGAGFLRAGRPLGDDFPRGLVGAQALECSLTHVAGACPAGEFDFGDELRLHPLHVAALAWCIRAGERTRVAGERLEPLHQIARFRLAESGADAADRHEIPVVVHADQQRAQPRAFARPAADHDFVPSAAFRLGPVADAPRTVGRIEALGDDAFEVHATRRFEHVARARFEMIDIADRALCAKALRLQQLLQQRLALTQRLLAQIMAVEEQEIEREQHEIFDSACGQCGLQRAEVRCAIRVERSNLAVDDAIGKLGCRGGERLELVGPVQTFARLQRRFVRGDAQLHAIAVELRLVPPLVALRWLLDELAQLRLDEVRDFAGCLLDLLGIPDGVRACQLARVEHEGLRRTALASRDVAHRTTGRHGSIFVEQLLRGRGVAHEFVTMLDEQPVRALAVVAIAFHAHQHPAALQALAGHRELQLALAQLLFGRALAERLPVTAIPQLHGAAAVLAFRDRAFEVAVVERVIFDLHGQPFVLRRQGGALRHRPGFEHAVELQAQVVVQPTCRVFLDHETQLLRCLHRQLAAGLGSLREIALATVGGKLAGRHVTERSAPVQRSVRNFATIRPATTTGALR